jgi:uncharacterized membrane protein YphA (DoxX/SURF4 family)
MYAFLRIILGLLFVVSGAEKVLSPYQNFVYAIEAYQLLPGWASAPFAQVFPWFECLTGLFLMLGLWTKKALLGAIVMTGMFILVVTQALLRHLPLDQCGCFGELVHVPPRVILVFDSAILLLLYMLDRGLKATSRFSLDNYFRR